jgi:hypothetical protein
VARVRAVVAVVLLGLAAPGAARGAISSTPDRAYVTNGPVLSVARDGNTVYLGGVFSKIGPRTGPLARLSRSTGLSDAAFPELALEPGAANAFVSDIVEDGSGGWYVAGRFDRAGARERVNVVHILAGGAVDPAFDADVDGVVRELALSGQRLFIGGQSLTVDGEGRDGVAALNAATGALVDEWDPPVRVVGPEVGAIAVRDGAVYIGASMIVSGELRDLVAVDASDGDVLPFDPDLDAGAGGVRTLLATATRLYVGGFLGEDVTTSQAHLVVFDRATGASVPFAPKLDGTVLDLDAENGVLYVAGSFMEIGGQSRLRLAAFSEATGAMTGWAPSVDPQFTDGEVRTLDVRDGTVFFGGRFEEVTGARRDNLAAVDAATGTATAWDPGATGGANVTRVQALVAGGTAVMAGGDFGSAGLLPRSSLAALDAHSGEPTAWAPDTRPTGLSDGLPPRMVEAIVPAGDVVYVGGNFGGFGDATRWRVAALSKTTGTPTAWNPGALDGGGRSVKALAVDGDLVYVGGHFDTMGGAARDGLAAIRASDGTATPWNPAPGFMVEAIAPAGAHVFVGGQFTSIGGAPSDGLAKVSASTGAAAPWDANVDRLGGSPAAADIEVRDGTVYFSGSFESVAGQARLGVAAVDAATAALKPFGAGRGPASPKFDVTPAIELGTTSAYIGGSMPTLVELGLPGGTETAWDPTRATEGVVWDLDLGPDGTLHAGGRFRAFFVPRMHYAAVDGYAAFRDHGPPVAAGAPHVRLSRGPRCTPGVWDGNTPMTFTYVWKRDGTPIPGATGDRYAVARADGGHDLTCQVTATNAAGSATATSAPVAAPYLPPLNTVLPSIAGATTVGAALTCAPGEWIDSSSAFGYTWLRNGVAIPGASGAGYVVAAADVGASLICRVTATGPGGSAIAVSRGVFIQPPNDGGGGPGGVPIIQPPPPVPGGGGQAPITTRPPVGGGTAPPAVPTAGPAVKLAAGRTQDVDRLAVTVRLGESASVRVSGSVSVPGPAKVLRFRPVSRRVAAGRPVAFRLRLSKSGLRAVKRALARGRVQARVTVRAVGARGTTTATRRIGLRR